MTTAEVLSFPTRDEAPSAPVTRVRAVVPRHDEEAERAVLAAILLDKERSERVLARLSAILTREDFYAPKHGVIWEAMQAVASTGADIDVITVVAQLGAMGRLNTVGGAQYIGELTDEIPTLAHCESHAHIVAEHAAGRRIAEAGHALACRAALPGAKLDELMSKHLEALRAVRLPGRKTLRLSDDLDGTMAEIEHTAADESWRYLSTGLGDIDDALGGGGYSAGVHLIASRPSLGKTAWALQLARATCTRGEAVYFLEAEMALRSLNRISIAALARVDYNRVQHPKALTQDDFNACVRAVNTIDAWPFFVAARGQEGLPRTTAEITSAVRNLPVKPRAVVIDHVGKIRPRGKYFQLRDAYREISDDLVGMARDLDLPVIVLAHISRAIAQGSICRRPRVEDLAECSALEADADSVTLLHNEAIYPTRKYEQGEEPDQSIVEMCVAKARNTKRNQIVRLRFRGALQTFEELEPRQHDDPAQEDLPMERFDG